MKKYQIKIKGTSPLLHHRFAEEEHGVNKSTMKKKTYDPEEEAKKAAYIRDNKLSMPSEHIYSAMIKAAVNFKYESKKTYKDLIKAGVILEPEYIDMNKKKWDEIDTRSVVIQRSRVIRWRPRYNEWEVQFELTIIDENISETTVKEILDYAGKYVGVGDYRPRYGRFMVTQFEELKT